MAGVRLPAQHVRRGALVDRARRTDATFVEAPGGFGKSTLLAEIVAEHRGPGVIVRLEPDDAGLASFVARLGRALRRAGLTDAAALLAEGSARLGEHPTVDPTVVSAIADVVVALFDRVDEPTLVAVDDVHLASPEVIAVVRRLADELADDHRLVVLGRHIDPALCGRIAQGTALRLDAADLRFTLDDTRALLTGSGIAPTAFEVEHIQGATEGWAAALVLTASNPSGTMPTAHDTASLVGKLVADALGRVSATDRAAAVQLALLPIVDAAVAEAVADAGIVGRLARAGLPLAPDVRGFLAYPGPVADLLSGLAPLDPAVARRVSDLYRRAGRAAAALRLLVRAGLGRHAAEVIGELSLGQLEAIEIGELDAIIGSLLVEAADLRASVLCQLARAMGGNFLRRRRQQVLTEAIEHLESASPLVRRAIRAEWARERAYELEFDTARTEGLAVLAEAGGAEVVTRARALEAVGIVNCYDIEAVGPPADLAFREAARLLVEIGERGWASYMLVHLGYSFHYGHGRVSAAIAVFDEALALLPAPDRRRADALVFKAEILVVAGNYEAADAALSESSAIAARFDDHRVLAYVYWAQAKAAAQRGDLAATRDLAREVERHVGDWFEHHTGLNYLATMADSFDRLGDPTLAAAYLERARRRRHEEEGIVRLAEAGIAARSGDPSIVTALLDHPAVGVSLERREAWRIPGIRAQAAARSGDLITARALAAEAVALATACEPPSMHWVVDRELAALLDELTVTGDAAPHRTDDAGTILVSTLGRFEVTANGRPLEGRPGQATEALKIVIAAGGRVTVDAVIEGLWPDAEPVAGRKRLRNVLSRLRDAWGELVVRNGNALELADRVVVDVEQFDAFVERALDLADPATAEASARSAIAMYRGPFLPDDPYEAWAAVPRERYRRSFLAAVDVVAAEAGRRGEVDDAVRHYELAITADPYDDHRYLAAARLLLDHGRRGAAADLIARADRALDELGLNRSPAHVALVRALG